MSAQLNLYWGTEVHSSVITKLHHEENEKFFNTSASLLPCNYDGPLLGNLNKAFWHFASEIGRAARPRPSEGRKNKTKDTFLLLCRPFFLNWRWGLLFVAPWFSWSQQQTSTNSKEYLTVRLVVGTVFSVHSFKNGHFQSSTQHAFTLWVFVYYHEVIFTHQPPHAGPGGLKLQSQDHCFVPYILLSSLESPLESPLVPVKFYSLGHLLEVSCNTSLTPVILFPSARSFRADLSSLPRRAAWAISAGGSWARVGEFTSFLK